MDKPAHVKQLLDSFNKYVKRDLIERSGNVEIDFRNINNSKTIVVSHNGANDPILNFGNQAALELWELNWEDFTNTPSRKTAESDFREKREKMLKIAEQDGFFDNYEGVRISATGKRFMIKQAIIWNVENEQGDNIGQAATFSDITFL
jgi:hypothetical protein